MALAWSFESLDTPIFSATRRALRVLAPVAHVSATAATRARPTRPLAVAVSAVRPAAAQLVGLGVHHGVHDLLGEAPEQLLHVDGAVVGAGHGGHVRRRV